MSPRNDVLTPGKFRLESETRLLDVDMRIEDTLDAEEGEDAPVLPGVEAVELELL